MINIPAPMVAQANAYMAAAGSARPGQIINVDTSTLDAVLAPSMALGELRTDYDEDSNCLVFRNGFDRVIAASCAGHHFIHAL